MRSHPSIVRPCASGWLLTLCLASGCSVTGLDSASSRFNCNAPRGIPCSSTSGVYANSVAGTLAPTSAAPSADAEADAKASPANAGWPAREVSALPRREVPGAGQAIRSLPKQLRVLIFPWVDADNDLHDQAYLYMAVDPGRWLIEHSRAAIRNDAPLPRLAGSSPDATDAGTPDGQAGAPAAAAPRTPALVIPHLSPGLSPHGTPRLNPPSSPPLGIVEQRED